MVYSSLDRITKIIQNLNKFSYHRIDLEIRPISAKSLTHECLALIQAKAKESEVEIIIKKFVDKNLYCDDLQLQQVLVNLINNAIDENKNIDGAFLEIELKESTHHDEIIIKDSGKGIDERTLDKIFTPFYTTKDVGSDTGLGLSISKGILDDHNGELVYRLIDGHTAFVIRLLKGNQ